MTMHLPLYHKIYIKKAQLPYYNQPINEWGDILRVWCIPQICISNKEVLMITQIIKKKNPIFEDFIISQMLMSL